MLSLAILIQYRSVTDTHRNRHTEKQTHDNSIYFASIVSRNSPVVSYFKMNNICDGDDISLSIRGR